MEKNIFDQIELLSGPGTFKGIRQVNGLTSGFDDSLLEDGYLYLVRTSEDKKYGYVYLNGKRYGNAVRGIDCGIY